MRYLFVGDTHGTQDLDKLRSRAFMLLGMEKQDALIHCGDFGAPWQSQDDEALRFFRALSCKVIICLGNHENYDWIDHQSIVTRFQCRGYDLGGKLFAPLPGEMALLGGRSFWFYPGGYSLDYSLRKPGKTIFAREMLSLKESNAAITRFFRRGEVDYVISHDGPLSFVQEQFGFHVSKPPKAYYDHLELPRESRAHPAHALERVYQSGCFGRWYFGHHHRDAQQGNVRCLFHLMALEDSRNDRRLFIDPNKPDETINS